MRAIVLCAGRGRRLLPATARTPKCLIPVDGDRNILALQLDALARSGIRSVTLMVGFEAGRIVSFLSRHRVDGLDVRTSFNPFFDVSDNLITCWLARSEMRGDFVLLNGDTIFDPGVLQQLLAARPAPVRLVIDRKREYTEDDMKVTLGERGRLRSVGKTIPRQRVDAESVGITAFRNDGVARFRMALERAVRRPQAPREWYLSVIDEMAASGLVETVSVEGRWWREIDSPEDLAEVRASFERAARRTGAGKPVAPGVARL